MRRLQHPRDVGSRKTVISRIGVDAAKNEKRPFASVFPRYEYLGIIVAGDHDIRHPAVYLFASQPSRGQFELMRRIPLGIHIMHRDLAIGALESFFHAFCYSGYPGIFLVIALPAAILSLGAPAPETAVGIRKIKAQKI
jgi:hypothetical protein